MEALKSKSFVSSVIMATVMVAVAYFPELASVKEELIASLTVITVALVTGHKGKDIALALIEAIGNRTSIQDELATEEAPQA